MRSPRTAAWSESQLRHFDVLAVSEETTVAYAVLRVSLNQAGHPIPANDAWIAALALQHRLAVLSRDEHFDVVPGLSASPGRTPGPDGRRRHKPRRHTASAVLKITKYVFVLLRSVLISNETREPHGSLRQLAGLSKK